MEIGQFANALHALSRFTSFHGVPNSNHRVPPERPHVIAEGVHTVNRSVVTHELAQKLEGLLGHHAMYSKSYVAVPHAHEIVITGTPHVLSGDCKEVDLLFVTVREFLRKLSSLKLLKSLPA